jgi:hypothetical protein
MEIISTIFSSFDKTLSFDCIHMYALSVVVDDGSMAICGTLHDEVICKLMGGMSAQQFVSLGYVSFHNTI